MTDNLYSQMAKVMGQVSRLKKTGTHPKHGYAFATDADVSDLIRELLAEHGIAFFPAMVARQEQIGTTSNGAPVYRTFAEFQMTLAYGDQTFTCAWASEADDMQDKGTNKAATAGVKYWLLKTFLVSTGNTVDDPDAVHVENAAFVQRNDNGMKPGETVHRTLTHVEIKMGKNGKPFLWLVTDKNDKFAVFTRKAFIDGGWISEDDWSEVTPLRKLETPISAQIQWDGQYWQLMEVAPVVF